MKLITSISPLLLASACFLSSCSSPSVPNPAQKKPLKAVYINPHKPGTYAHFKAQKGYPRNYGIWKNESVLAKTNGSNARIVIDLSDQRGRLYNGNELAMDYPIASGRAKFPTPVGDFKILEKIKTEKRSGTYGRIYDASGALVKSNANLSKDKVPPGGKYVGASMPYWMRITWDGIGMHKGNVPRYPASHGCIRTYYKAVPIVFAKTRVGTPVKVVR